MQTVETVIDSLWEKLIMLDEQSGCFDEETNAKIDKERAELLKTIKSLENAEALENVYDSK